MDQDQSKILLVEGLDDKRVITEILHAWDTPCPHIEPCDGCENLFRMLKGAERALVNLERNEIQQYTPAHRPKAKMHTYLAWQKEPGRTLACAVAKHYFDASSEKARPFIDWVTRLYA